MVDDDQALDESSLLAGGPGTGDDDNSLTSDSEDEQLMSDAEKAQRKVMLQLVYGSNKPKPRVDPVDAKVERMIRESLQKAVSTSTITPTTQDDMAIETSYNTSTPFAPALRVNDFPPGCNGVRRQRSNSLPMELDDSAEKQAMDMDT